MSVFKADGSIPISLFNAYQYLVSDYTYILACLIINDINMEYENLKMDVKVHEGLTKKDVKT